MVKLRIAALLLPVLVTLAFDPAAPVVVLPIAIVAAAPFVPFVPAVPCGPCGPCAPSAPAGPVGPAGPCETIVMSRYEAWLVSSFSFESSTRSPSGAQSNAEVAGGVVTQPCTRAVMSTMTYCSAATGVNEATIEPNVGIEL